MSPTAERAVQTLKRQIRLSSHLVAHKFWWEVLNDSVTAVNNIRKREGFTAQQLVNAFKRGDEATLTKFRRERRGDEHDRDQYDSLPELTKGDRVRIRIAPVS